ncbi:MAG: lipolytic protein family [Bacilli bacterium]|nr:lipolytic protein family [Bacilli bacterium]
MIVVLGDSISVGIGASHFLARFPARLPASMVIAKPGWTSKRLLKEAQQQPPEIWQEATSVVVLIGGNDLLFSYPYLVSAKKTVESVQKIFDTYQQSINGICEIVKTSLKPAAKIYLAGLYNPFPNAVKVTEVISRINRITSLVAKQHGAVYVDLYHVFEHKEKIAIEGFKQGKLEDLRIFHNPIHPSNTGHKWIAEAIIQAMQPKTTLKLPSKSAPKLQPKARPKVKSSKPNKQI